MHLCGIFYFWYTGFYLYRKGQQYRNKNCQPAALQHREKYILRQIQDLSYQISLNSSVNIYKSARPLLSAAPCYMLDVSHQGWAVRKYVSSTTNRKSENLRTWKISYAVLDLPLMWLFYLRIRGTNLFWDLRFADLMIYKPNFWWT